MNRIKHFASFAAVSLLLAAASIAPAAAITNAGDETAIPYVAAFAPVFGNAGVPHTGVMQLIVSAGTISGTYTGTSVAPDYLNNRIVPVSGSVSPNDGYVQLSIGGAFTLRGTMAGDGSISGTATYGGRLYEFVAQPGARSNGPRVQQR